MSPSKQRSKPAKPGKVRVSAPARIHMGILNPARQGGRRLYGSVGVGVQEPRTVVEVEPAEELEVVGLSAEESKGFAKKILRHFSLKGARIRVVSLPKRHSGLGSTTQLSLSIATGVTKAYGLDSDPISLAGILGRGEQSGIGTHVFHRGGFVVEGGWGDETSFPPLLFRYPFPEEWRLLIVVPESRSYDERQELEAFRELPTPKENLVYEACYRLLMGMAPAILENKIQVFGENLSRLQELVGEMFSTAQGGVFQPQSVQLIKEIKELGAVGVGQSSWGPAVYALFDADGGRTAIERLRKKVLRTDSIKEHDQSLFATSDWGEIFFTRADNRGAFIETY